jgi:hypothetical protein
MVVNIKSDYKCYNDRSAHCLNVNRVLFSLLILTDASLYLQTTA